MKIPNFLSTNTTPTSGNSTPDFMRRIQVKPMLSKMGLQSYLQVMCVQKVQDWRKKELPGLNPF